MIWLVLAPDGSHRMFSSAAKAQAFIADQILADQPKYRVIEREAVPQALSQILRMGN
jgi:hypothetical protein